MSKFVKVSWRALNTDHVEEWSYVEKRGATQDDINEGEATQLGQIFPARFYARYASGNEFQCTGQLAQRYAEAFLTQTYVA